PAAFRQSSGMPQEYQAVASFPARICVREMHPDIAQRGGAENRVRDCVRENVGVGMPFEAEFTRDRDAAEDQRPVGREAMDIPAQPGSDVGQVRTLAVSSRRNSRANSISLGFVIL